jgi:hypothetical protein
VVFGLEVGAEEANQRALAAATRVRQRLRALGDRFAHELGWAADFVIHLHTGPAGVGETGDNAVRTLAVVGNTVDVARQLAAQHENGQIARIVLSEAVMIAAGLNTRAANWREIVLTSNARLKVASTDSARVLPEAEPLVAG